MTRATLSMLDELDKAVSDNARTGDPLGQLHGTLEPQNAQIIGVQREIDASRSAEVRAAGLAVDD